MTSNQETFDRVVNHLLTQGKPAYKVSEDYTGCMYRFLDDEQMLMCAAGCLIPDEKYTEKMENGIVLTEERDIDECPNCCRLVTKVIGEEGYDLPLVSRLQSVHDKWPDHRNINLLKDDLKIVANHFDLIWNFGEN